MASFIGLSFDFANDSSHNYDVYLVNYGVQPAPFTESAGSGTTIISDSVPRRAEQLFYGIKQDLTQQFTVTIGSDKPRSRADIDRILGWLLTPRPERLHINQPDMENYFYHGIFSDPQLTSVDGMPFGVQLTFNSMSPFAHSFPKIMELDIKRPETIVLNNIGDSLDYLCPTIEYKPTNITQFLSLVNSSDGNRTFRMEFKPASNGAETITIDNKNQIIQSSQGFGRQRFSCFNMNWFRLVRGTNEIEIIGNGLLKFGFSFAKRIGN